MRYDVQTCLNMGILTAAKVFFNDIEVKKVVMADEERGTIEQITENHEVINDDIATYFSYGRVKVVY